MERLNEPPITQWAIMKSKLKEKYVPRYYRNNKVPEMMNFKQSTSSVTEYMENFEETLHRCDLCCDSVENPFLVLHQFINGLRLNIQKELKLYSLETIEEAYHKALKIESYYQFPTSCRFTSQSVRSYQPKSSPQSVALGFYDHYVLNHGKENTYVFKFHGKKIILISAKPSQKNSSSSKPKPKSSIKAEKKITILNHMAFEKVGSESKYCLAVIAK
ncbi:hypothetical protein GH714_034482 [Hevea brasiliensis]|uniref:Retrotransposon gag domain-containing protein n=1 Tax=Hevea brasiliensis TaxID=3981 RepID=A0A6A6LRU9_HEVBR|nr:hypothetical protein GH714_034482 [Hevea brasiliensis]